MAVHQLHHRQGGGASHGADIKGLVPENVRQALLQKYQQGEVRQGTPCLAPPYGGFRVL